MATMELAYKLKEDLDKHYLRVKFQNEHMI